MREDNESIINSNEDQTVGNLLNAIRPFLDKMEKRGRLLEAENAISEWAKTLDPKA
jgi:hypothetical protein